MTDMVKLSELIEASGITITALAEKCGMSRETFYNRMAGKSEFKASEIYSLSNVLHMTQTERDSIFFGD